MQEQQPHRSNNDDLQWINKHDKKQKWYRRTHNKKLIKLKNDKNKHYHVPNNNASHIPPEKADTSNVVNLSDHNLTQDQISLLSKGLKFIPTPKQMNVINFITNTESALSYTPTTIKQAAISEITTFIQRWKKPKIDNLTKQERIAMNEIKNNKEIIVIPADKGGKIVVMNQKDYKEKMEEKLNDKKTYEQVKDPTNMIKNKLNELLNKLLSQRKIDKHMKKYLTSIDDLPKLRGQPKLHKINNPMRIITCSSNSILTPLSKFVYTYIKQLREKIQNTIKNTNDLIQKLSKTKIEPNEYLASLDVEDLYTNVPVTRAIDIVINELGYSEKFCQSSFSKTDIKQMLLLILNNGYVEFDGKVYRQVKGLPMGNNISPLLADLYMDNYIKQKLSYLDSTNKIWRYVDDILTPRSQSNLVSNYTLIKSYNQRQNKTQTTNKQH
ncbi:unnamed protein product [Rotaria sordida]|uniref:Reverse transcriptase domain-containing protein n=2 Tax=Rotaria sordida TaxID=392033 RepID=A0A819Z5Y2_9BILA|nr:unnamed protein product [Rotaria sordida]CAF4164999.1 unnamed protein product [Rotaria sordida]